MGLQDFPYPSLQWQARLKLKAYSDYRIQTNPFHWEKVIFNLCQDQWDTMWIYRES